MGYQNRRNTELYWIKDQLPNVVNHKKWVSDINTELRDTVKYCALQYDSVHFKDYVPIAKKLLSYVF